VFTAPESTLDDFSLTVSDFDAPFPFVTETASAKLARRPAERLRLTN